MFPVQRWRECVAGVAVVPLLLLVACGDDGAAAVRSAPPCPTDPVRIVVSVSQWGDIVSDLAGACGDVTTIVRGTAIDPHDYEPTPADLNAFTDARLVVVNGVGYDAWASKAADTTSPKPLVVDAGDVVGKKPGDNPHIWYDPDYVRAVASAITTQLEAVAPAASPYFEAQAATWRTEMKSYDDTVSEVRSQAAGAVTYGATESVFDYMAAAVGLVDKTPEGYAHAVANESEPAPADLHDFLTAIGDGSIDLLIVNTQTEGSVPDQLRKAAEVAGVPIVEVTESPPTSSTFVSWQVGQLEALAKAVGSSR